MSARLTISQAKKAFDLIDLSYAYQDAAVDILDEVRLSYVGRRSGAPCGGAMIVAPMGCGKTRAVEDLERQVSAEGGHPPGARPVLLVNMPTEARTDDIPTAILTALGFPRPDLGRMELRWRKATKGMLEAGVQLVVFDEFNRANRRPTMSRPIATSIRERIMDEGIAPVAFVGSEEAGLVLKACPELAERLDERIPLQPLEWFEDADKEVLLDLLGQLDATMTSTDLFGSSNLKDEAVAEPLAAACGGRIRSLMKIVRSAMGLALERDARSIDWCDLEQATERFAVASGFIARNPFTREA